MQLVCASFWDKSHIKDPQGVSGLASALQAQGKPMPHPTVRRRDSKVKPSAELRDKQGVIMSPWLLLLPMDGTWDWAAPTTQSPCPTSGNPAVQGPPAQSSGELTKGKQSITPGSHSMAGGRHNPRSKTTKPLATASQTFHKSGGCKSWGEGLLCNTKHLAQMKGQPEVWFPMAAAGKASYPASTRFQHKAEGHLAPHWQLIPQ